MRHVRAVCLSIVLAACESGGVPPTVPGTPPEQELSRFFQPIFAGCGTPSVDGVLSPGEWDGAVPVRFALQLPECNGPGREILAEVMARSDDQNLDVAFRVHGDLSPYLLDLGVALGDEPLRFSWPSGGASGAAQFDDGFNWECLVGPGERRLCFSLDTNAWEANLPSGTTDGGGAIHYAAGETTIELWHPYTGGDPRDVAWVPGQGFDAWFQMSVRCPNWNTAPTDYGHSFVLGACTAPPPELQMVEVRIDAPGDPLPIVDLRTPGSIAVAIMGSAAFDVANVDPFTLYFDGAPVARAPPPTLADVNGDGLDDLVARFDTAGMMRWIGPSELTTVRTLAGRTRDGRRFYGINGVRLILDQWR